MATVYLYRKLFIFLIICGIGLFGRIVLAAKIIPNRSLVRTANLRVRLVSRARGEIGVREFSGRNDGRRVEEYLASVGLPKGYPYCAAFVSWVFKQEGLSQPRSAWCPDLFPGSRLARSALTGNVLGIYFADRKRIAHVGIIESVHGDYCISIEANTDVAGSREGEGVYRRRRHLKTIHCFADWVDPGKGKK